MSANARAPVRRSRMCLSLIKRSRVAPWSSPTCSPYFPPNLPQLRFQNFQFVIWCGYDLTLVKSCSNGREIKRVRSLVSCPYKYKMPNASMISLGSRRKHLSGGGVGAALESVPPFLSLAFHRESGILTGESPPSVRPSLQGARASEVLFRSERERARAFEPSSRPREAASPAV